MRKLGIIGGMSWVSTVTYYDQINRIVQQRVSRHASAPLLIESLDFAELYGLNKETDWDVAAKVLSDSARRLESAGAGAIVIGANSMHRVYDKVAESVSVPIIHIADCVGEKMAADEVKSAALLGTSNVMTGSFYRSRLVAHGVDLLPPDMNYVETLDSIIYDELMVGKASRNAERKLKTMITELEQDGAEAVVLACTELDQIVDVDANVLPIYDCTRIHAERAAEWIMGED